MSASGPPADAPPFGFFKDDGETPLRSIALRHLGTDRFDLIESFYYRGPSGTWRIDQDGLPSTDLVSVPWFLRWFIPPYGPHLLAALVHDWLIRNDPMSRSQADAVFDEALGVSRIPRLRRRLMAAAVSFTTRFETGGLATVGIVVWLVLSAFGIAVSLNSLLGWWRPSWWSDSLLWVAALGPLPASSLWGSQWKLGIAAGYGVLLLAPASMVVALTSFVYAIIEWFVPGYNRPPRGLDELADSQSSASDA